MVRNRQIYVGGRHYESDHVLIIGASSIVAKIEPPFVEIEASFSSLPEVQVMEENVLKISDPGSKYEVDTAGFSVSVSAEERGFTLKGSVISIKFEAKRDEIIVKAPKMKVMKGKALVLKASSPSAANIVIHPFFIGIVSLYEASVRASISGDMIEIEAKSASGA